MLADRLGLVLLLLSGLGNALSSSLDVVETGSSEVVVSIPGGRRLAIGCRASAFSLRLLGDSYRAPMETPMLAPVTGTARCKQVHGPGSEQGLAQDSAAGAALTVDLHGRVRLRSAGGELIVESEPVRKEEQLIFHQKLRLLGGGSSAVDAHDLTSSVVTSEVINTAVYSPHYYSEDGYAALAVVARDEVEQWNRYPANYSLTHTSAGKQVVWKLGGAWDMYIMPAASLLAGTKALYALVGAPPVPPRYVFGFIASRWGWEDRAYVEDTLGRFRRGKFPIDAIIIDFEWFTNETDYGYAPFEGRSYYKDFDFNEVLFPEPRYQLADYNDRYHIKVAGIRKPRIGNEKTIEELVEKKWLLEHCEPGGAFPPQYFPGYACGRALNYTKPEVREWYADQLQPVLDAGMAFWWNDEGETDYFTFHYWNEAQVQALHQWQPSARFFSLNRAFSPGMARLGATVWTGDVPAKWEALAATPGTMLKWGLAGAPYVGCDSGGFGGESNPLLLVRWLQVATFMPIMRVHSELKVKAHWPWLWGPRAAVALRQTLSLRYRLLPYHYSLAHAQFANGEPWIRPLLMDFPKDPEVQNLTTQWMDGAILVAPLLSNSSKFDVHLPEGLWYRLDHAVLAHEQEDAATNEGRNLRDPEILTQAPSLAAMSERAAGVAMWNEVPAFVRPGTVLPLASPVQHSGEVAEHPLQVFVFGGDDGTFELVEDDGVSTSYTQGFKRVTRLTWDDADKILTWDMSGQEVKQGFSQIDVIFIDVEGRMRKAPQRAFARTGKIQFQETNQGQFFE